MVYPSFAIPEELEMTFQVGLVGHNGLVIASDRRAVASGQNIDARWLMRQTGDARKILHSKELDFVCVFSLSDHYKKMAEALVEDKDRPTLESDDYVRSYLQEKCEMLLKQIPQEYRFPGASLIVALPKARAGVKRLWQVSFFLGETPHVNDRVRAYGGDLCDPAIYFAERYHGRLDEKELSVRELTAIAAHTVLEASQLNMTQIRGLDVLLCEDGTEPHFIEGDKLLNLKQQSSRLSAKIEKLLLGWDETDARSSDAAKGEP